jgi:hypothetical protein
MFLKWCDEQKKKLLSESLLRFEGMWSLRMQYLTFRLTAVLNVSV